MYFKNLRKSFPDAKFSLFAYNTVENYLQHLDQYSQMYPDIIAAADIEDDASLMKGSIKDYEELCEKSRKYNPASIAVFLSRKGVKMATNHESELNGSQLRTE